MESVEQLLLWNQASQLFLFYSFVNSHEFHSFCIDKLDQPLAASQNLAGLAIEDEGKSNPHFYDLPVDHRLLLPGQESPAYAEGARQSTGKSWRHSEQALDWLPKTYRQENRLTPLRD